MAVLVWVLLILLVLGALAFVAAPLLRRASAGREEERRLALLQKEAALQLLRDLELDRQTGKLDEQDYADQRAAAEERAVTAMRILDALGETAGEDPIERAIRMERLRLEKGGER